MRPAAAAAVVAAAACALLAGCPAHVLLDAPPPPSAPVQMRQAYYETHAPTPPERGEFVVRTRLFENKPTFTQKAVRLENGVRVAYVEDLRPLVPPQGEVAAAIDASLAARGTADIVTGAGLAVGVVGLVAGGGVLTAYLLNRDVNPDAAQTFDPLLVGGAGGVVAGVLAGAGLIGWGTTIRDDEDDARTAAFKGLDAALKKKLALDAEPGG